MKMDFSPRIRLSKVLAGATFVIALVVVGGTRAGNEPIHLSSDWSDRHLVFSPPTSLIHHFALSNNPRFVKQWVRRNAERRGEEDFRRRRHPVPAPNDLHGDWNVYLGNLGRVGAGKYPAKFSFDVTAANCASAAQPDFVVWNTSLAGSGAAVAAFDTGTFSATAALNSTITITNGANTLTMTAAAANAHTGGAGSGTGTFNRGGSANASATGLAAAINIANNGSFVGVSAASAGAVVTITATTAGTAGNSIAITASVAPASNFTATFANLVNGASGVASIAAYDNLYTSCTGTVPSPYWAYNTGGTAQTSVALSFDGQQVAFVQTQAGVANLVILKWAGASGTVNAPVTLATQASAAAYRACVAPCMFTIAFNGGRNDTNSSPFYDFNSDSLYVGDNPVTRGTTNATLHKFTGIFFGNPAEVAGGAAAWPVTLGTEIATSPVFDQTNGQVYVADSNTVGAPTGGFLYRVDATTGAVVTSTRLGRGVGFTDGPIVDSSNGTVYLFSPDGGILGCPNAATSNNVLQMAANFAAGAGAVTSAQVGATGTCSNTLSAYDGDFDDAYFSGGAGHLYTCGNIGGNPTLFQINVTAAGALGAVATGPNIATAVTTCSPITAFHNPNAAGGAKDWIFVSTQASAVTVAPINCPAAAGCLMSFDVTSGAAITAATPTIARVTVAGGASGVIIDNSSATAGSSQVYFTPLAIGNCTTATNQGRGGCAIQASQAALN